YIDVNSSATLLTGYSKEELLKMNVSDVFFTNDENSHPFSGDQLDDGKPLLNESIIRQKAGSHIHVEISAKLLEDGRYQGIVRDIVARKTAEEELRNSEMKYRLLFEQNPMPMFMLSIPERDFLDVNNAAVEFYGYSREEFLSMNAYDLRSEDETEKLENYYAQNPNGINHAGIWTHLKKDGTEVKMDIITHYITNDGRNARLVLANDVTEKLDAEINLQKSHEQLRLLATHLEDIRESERTHMAREIHDELGQQLTGLKMDIAWLNRKIKSDDLEVQQKIKDTIQLIDTTVITVRRIATELRPSILDDLGLIPAMEWQSEEFQKRSEIETNFVSNLSNFAASPEVATGIFRVYQESLTNVMRHAQASKVEASLNIADDSLELVITDNGKGFLIETISNKRTLGLLGMKERVNLMGGTYEIISAPGHGTSVKINVPLS
ncbi:MAG: PAS domain S-box protein, partial [Pedobacter sp.]